MNKGAELDIEQVYNIIQENLEAYFKNEYSAPLKENKEMLQCLFDFQPILLEACSADFINNRSYTDTNWLAQKLKADYKDSKPTTIDDILQVNLLMEEFLGTILSNHFKDDVDHTFFAMDEEHESREAVTDVELSGMNKQITNGMHKAAMMEFKHSLYKNGYLAKMDDMSVDSYDFKNAAYYLGNNAMLVGSGSILISAMIQLSMAVIRQKDIDKNILIAKALQRGGDNGVSIAVAGAIRIAVEKGFIPLLSQGTPVAVSVAIAVMGVECSKLMLGYANGEITGNEVLDQAGKTFSALTYRLGFASQGALLGSIAFAAIPVVGSLVGSILGSMVGNAIGRKMAQKHYAKTKQLIKVAQFHLNIGRKITLPVYQFNRMLATVKC